VSGLEITRGALVAALWLQRSHVFWLHPFGSAELHRNGKKDCTAVKVLPLLNSHSYVQVSSNIQWQTQHCLLRTPSNNAASAYDSDHKSLMQLD
jgi:hypothetical protein